MASDEWHAAQRAIRATARRCAPRHLRQEVIDQAEDVCLEHVMRGRQVANWVCYSAKVTRSVVRRMQRRNLAPLADEVVAPAPRWSFEQLVAGDALPLDLLRGAMQRHLVSAVLSGSACAAISESLGIPEKEVRRQILKLVAIVWSRRRNLGANFHRATL